MGKRANALLTILRDAGAEITEAALRRPSYRDIEEAGLAPEVLRVYRDLGGVGAVPRVRPGSWDIEADGVGVELDEERHFNRYRLKTLESSLYDQFDFPGDLYRSLCAEYEGACLAAASWGGNWTNPSAAVEFGSGSDPGEFAGGGAPRWKQRAFYDFIKDTAPVAAGVPVSRLSIWETVGVGKDTYPVGTGLERLADGALPAADWNAALTALVQRRTFSVSRNG
jgi:hypothetical protein